MSSMQVVIRPRELNQEEKDKTTDIEVKFSSSENSITINNTANPAIAPKIYKYDRIFSEKATTTDIYTKTVKKYIDPVLDGNSATIFVYGPSTCGKTTTMIGSGSEQGIIAQAVHSIYKSLGKIDNEYIITASYCELFNEVISDLFFQNNQELQVVDDPIRGVVVKGLSEITSTKEADVQSALTTAFKRRQSEDNTRKVYSHAIFTMIIYMREISPKGEEYMKIGKMTFVEVAGSECVGQNPIPPSEKMDIKVLNQSLYALHRLIRGIIDRVPQLPFNDSQLTKLLVDSFNGKGYTCFIGNLCGSQSLYEDLLNSLDVLHRIKSMRNRPEQNKKVLKATILQDYSRRVNELEEQFKKIAQQQIYINENDYTTMKKALEDKTKLLTQAEKDLKKTSKHISELQKQVVETDIKLDDCIDHLGIHQENEDRNVIKAKQLIRTVEEAVKDVKGYHGKVQRICDVETFNQDLNNNIIMNIKGSLSEMHKTVEEFQEKRDGDCQKLLDDITSFVEKQTGELDEVHNNFQVLYSSLYSKFKSMCNETVMVQLKELDHQVEVSKAKLNLWYKAVCDKIDKNRLSLVAYHEQKKTEITEFEKYVNEHCKEMTSDIEDELQSFHQSITAYQSDISNDYAVFTEMIVQQMEKMTSNHLARYSALTDLNTLYSQKEKARVNNIQEGGKERTSLMGQTEEKFNTIVVEQSKDIYNDVQVTEKDHTEAYAAYADSMATLKDKTEKDKNSIIKETEKEGSITSVLTQLTKDIQSWGVVQAYDDLNAQITVYHNDLFSRIAGMELLMKNYINNYMRTVSTAETPRERDYPISVEFPICQKCNE